METSHKCLRELCRLLFLYWWSFRSFAPTVLRRWPMDNVSFPNLYCSRCVFTELS